jgi:hypothetical protein
MILTLLGIVTSIAIITCLSVIDIWLRHTKRRNREECKGEQRIRGRNGSIFWMLALPYLLTLQDTQNNFD